MRPLLALLLIAVGSVVAAPVPKELRAKKGDAALIVGRWKPSDGTQNWYEFKADGTMKAWSGQGEATAVPYLWTMDPTPNPKRMTWKDAKTGRVMWEAVYELEGDDLRMTYTSSPKVPPAVVRGPGLNNSQSREKPSK